MKCFSRASVVLSVALLVTCGEKSSSPTAPTPTPTPTPTPAPPPQPPAATLTCQWGYGDPRAARCQVESPTYLADLDLAIDTLMREEPDIFDGNSILSVGRYYQGLILNLNRQGLCAEYDGEELGIRGQGNFSDHFDVQTGRDEVRRGPATYMGSCTPASIPSRQDPPPTVGGCRLGGSRAIACGREPSSRFLDVMEATIGQLTQTRPDLVDANDGKSGGHKVKNVNGFLQAVVDSLNSQGYCGFWDGEEMGIKKTNDVSEHLDILTGDDYTRYGFGTYRGSCYPAYF